MNITELKSTPSEHHKISFSNEEKTKELPDTLKDTINSSNNPHKEKGNKCIPRKVQLNLEGELQAESVTSTASRTLFPKSTPITSEARNPNKSPETLELVEKDNTWTLTVKESLKFGETFFSAALRIQQTAIGLTSATSAIDPIGPVLKNAELEDSSLAEITAIAEQTPPYTFSSNRIIKAANLTDPSSKEMAIPILAEIFSCMKENKEPDFSFINNPDQEDILVHLADFLCIDESKMECLIRLKRARENKVKAAALEGDLAQIQNLLGGGGANISKEDRGEAVCYAAEGGYLDVVMELLKDRAIISEQDRGRAVINAAEGGHLDVIEELLKNGANASISATSSNSEALSLQKLREKITKLRAVIKSTNHEIANYATMKTSHTMSPKTVPMPINLGSLNQRVASYQQNLKEAESKLAEITAIAKDGAIISEQDRRRAVIKAAEKGYLGIIQKLLQDGAIISEQGRGQAVINAAGCGYLDVVRELLQDGATIPEQSRGHAVIKATENGYLDIIQELLQDGAIIPKQSRAIAVICAIWSGHLNVIMEILKDGAMIPEQGRGYAVIKAAENGLLDIVLELLKDGASISKEDLSNAIDIAQKQGYSSIEVFLSNIMISDDDTSRK